MEKIGEKDTQLKYWRNVENRRKINPRIANMLMKYMYR